MSATILNCGHASHLMTVNTFEGNHQVHLHFLTNEWEWDLIGYGKAELCCHGCGASLLIYFDKSSGADVHTRITNRFKLGHSGCPDHGYQKECPNYRSSFSFLDLRPGKRKRKTRRRKIKPVMVLDENKS